MTLPSPLLCLYIFIYELFFLADCKEIVEKFIAGNIFPFCRIELKPEKC